MRYQAKSALGIKLDTSNPLGILQRGEPTLRIGKDDVSRPFFNGLLREIMSYSREYEILKISIMDLYNMPLDQLNMIVKHVRLCTKGGRQND